MLKKMGHIKPANPQDSVFKQLTANRSNTIATTIKNNGMNLIKYFIYAK